MATSRVDVGSLCIGFYINQDDESVFICMCDEVVQDAHVILLKY